MQIEEIHFHDTVITEDQDLLDSGELKLTIDYPVDWDSNVFAPRILIFRDASNYQIEEGPFEGNITILDVAVLERGEGVSTLRIETNAGYRMITCSNVELLEKG